MKVGWGKSRHLQFGLSQLRVDGMKVVRTVKFVLTGSNSGSGFWVASRRNS